ncbi:MAG: malate/lactate/ureidoglycolate dehydrogenase [Thalassobaculaceae bacterium]|nr:malate/lactate/ureidoglycolate dehydrogenase [Thalassobaculaceae bacterium]
MPITIGHERLTEIVATMMKGAKSSPEEARAIAENLVQANLMGHDSHGVGLAPRYMKHALSGTMNPGARPSVVTDNGAYLLLDGNMGYGQTVCREAMEMAIGRARQSGVCIMGLRRTHHMGRIGAWGEMAARAGLISIHYVNTTGHRPYVSPWGGYEAKYSTNPYCTAIPATDATPMIVLDMATSRVAQGKVRVAYYAGKKTPADALVGPDGIPTDDPKVIFEEPYGAMLSFGQHKGYGLAMICEILSAGLTGGGTAREELMSQDTICNNMLTIVMDPAGFGADIPFKSEIDQLVDHVSSAKVAVGHDKIRFPGDPERETAAERTANGIPIDDNTWAEMTQAGVDTGMEASAFGVN